jgi:uncharacterized phage protein (TIGR02220 family)
MSFAFMPIYTGDYQRDTRHLSMMEHGAYFNLLMHCWDQKGPIPLDERRAFAIANARSSEEMGAVRNVLAEFFVRMEDGHYNKRMADEIRRAEALSDARAQAGKRGGIARAAKKSKDIRDAQANAKQLLSKSQAIAKQEPVPPPPPLVKEEKLMSGPSDADVAHRLLDHLNEKSGRHYRAVGSNLKLLRARLRTATEAQIRAVIDAKCAEWLANPQMAQYLRPETLFGEAKFEQYLGQIAAPKSDNWLERVI